MPEINREPVCERAGTTRSKRYHAFCKADEGLWPKIMLGDGVNDPVGAGMGKKLMADYTNRPLKRFGSRRPDSRNIPLIHIDQRLIQRDPITDLFPEEIDNVADIPAE